MMKMKTHWTGGQFSIFRVVFGFYLLQHFSRVAAVGPGDFFFSRRLARWKFEPALALVSKYFS